MNERDLRYLVAIVECGGLVPAGARLGVTQPALTKCIDRLECELRAPLFLRRGRHVALTPTGKLFFERAKSILFRMDDVVRELADHAAGVSGHVRLGAAATVTEALAPTMIERMMSEAPGVTMELMTAMNDVLRDALRDDRIDMMIGPASEGESEFESEILFHDRVVVVARRGHPIGGRRAEMAEMLDYEWLLPPDSVWLRRWLDAAFEREGLPKPRVRIQVNSLVLTAELIGRSKLLSFTSRQKLANPRLVEVINPHTTYERKFGILRRRDAYYSPASLNIVRILREALEVNRLSPVA